MEVPAVPHRDLMKDADAEPSEHIRKRVSAARAIQSRRFSRAKIYSNAQMSSRHIKTHCRIDMDEPLTPRFDSTIDFATDHGLINAKAALKNFLAAEAGLN